MLLLDFFKLRCKMCVTLLTAIQIGVRGLREGGHVPDVHWTAHSRPLEQNPAQARLPRLRQIKLAAYHGPAVPSRPQDSEHHAPQRRDVRPDYSPLLRSWQHQGD